MINNNKMEKVEKKYDINYKNIIICFFFLMLILNIGLLLLGNTISNVNINKDMQRDSNKMLTEVSALSERNKRDAGFFVELMKQEIKYNNNADNLQKFLDEKDETLYKIEGNSFDGAYMCYKATEYRKYIEKLLASSIMENNITVDKNTEKYLLYSWKNTLNENEKDNYLYPNYNMLLYTWCVDAINNPGEIIITGPYEKYNSEKLIFTISYYDIESDAVFAYDINTNEIQQSITENQYNNDYFVVISKYDMVIGCTNAKYIGSDIKDMKIDTIKDGNGNQADITQFNNMKYYKYNNIDNSELNYTFLLNCNGTMFSYEMNWIIILSAFDILSICIFVYFVEKKRINNMKLAYTTLTEAQNNLKKKLTINNIDYEIDEMTEMLNDKSFKEVVKEKMKNINNECGAILTFKIQEYERFKQEHEIEEFKNVMASIGNMIIGRIRIIDAAARVNNNKLAVWINNIDNREVAENIADEIKKLIEKDLKMRDLSVPRISTEVMIVNGMYTLENINEFIGYRKQGDLYDDIEKLSTTNNTYETDTLTGMYNFESFKKMVEIKSKTIAASDKNAILTFEINNLEELKNKYGDDGLNQIIMTIRNMIIGRIHNIDVAARIDENKFIIWMANITYDKIAENISDNICSMIKNDLEKHKIKELKLNTNSKVIQNQNNIQEIEKILNE